MNVQVVTEKDHGWICSLLRERWGGVEIISRGCLHRADHLSGFTAFEDGQPLGLITYVFENGDCEIISLDSLESGKGIGSALVKAVVDKAINENVKRIWLVTTNDNTGALCFYQKIGFKLVAIHCGAVRKSRKLKPGIPEKGFDGIQITDEIELEIKNHEYPRI